MNRVWDYVGFAVWFAGLGYIVMWLLSSPDLLLLPPALHALGIASAMFVPALLLRAVSRRRAASRCACSFSAETRRRAAAAAAKIVIPAALGQTAQPFRPARHAGLNARQDPVFGKDRARGK